MADETIEQFKDIPDQMIWKPSALAQIQRFEDLARALGTEMHVVGEHRSKSIRLPVVHFAIDGCLFYLRDNFHDVNLCVLASGPIDVPLAQMFEGVYAPRSWDWYLEEIARCRGYSWRECTDEQMDDPNLLQLTKDAPSYMVKTPVEKWAWVRRLVDPAWYWTHWSHNQISWDGSFGPGATLWVQWHPFMQGIEELVPDEANRRYAPGCSAFSLAVASCAEAELIIRRVGASLRGK